MVLREQEFHLTPRQAQVVQLLHEQCAQGTPEVGQAFILEHLDLTSTNRLVDVFKGSAAWNALVVRGQKRGTYRLNMPCP